LLGSGLLDGLALRGGGEGAGGALGSRRPYDVGRLGARAQR
jgi:hypothetical protein